MKNMWQYLGQTYRHAAADGDAGGGGGGAGDAGAGDTGAGDGDAGGETGSGDAGAGGGEGAGGDGAGGTGDAGGDGDGGGQAAADGDWRKSIAGDDAAKLSRLERYTTVEDWNASAFEAHAKVRSGEISTGLPEDPTEEQLKNYREANNIPVDGKYNIELEGGMTLPDSESDMVDKFLEVSHAGNVPENVVNAQLSVYGTMINQVMDNMKAQDGLDEQQFNQIAKDNWGKDYEVNMSRVHNQMNLIPESVREAFMAARMPDGRAITNSPEIMNWIVSNDRGLNPMDPLPGGSEVSFSSAQQIINECKEMMREDIGAWHKNLEAQERFKQARNWMDKYNRDKEGG